MQVKLTAEPKKQALELLRRKIEAQDTKVQAVRRRYQAAKQVSCVRAL
jgi:chorismate mutase